MWAEPVGEDLDWRALGGEESERARWKDGWKADERGAVVFEAMIE